MNAEIIREYALGKKGVTESLPFDDETLVFKVMDKMFLLMSLEREPLSINVKCEPERATELRATFDEVMPGYHMNKKHWNTVLLSGHVTYNLATSWIDDSYQLIIDSLPKKRKTELEAL